MEVKNNIDEGLYSRQLYVLGRKAMQNMSESNILIVGLGGVGVEVAKDVILSGVKSVSLYDNKKVRYMDLSTQFYLNESNIGKNRAECCRDKLAELNSYVQVNYVDEKTDLSEEYVKQFTVVILTDCNLTQQLELNELCRNNNVKFIVAQTKGLCGQIFVDFGESFRVNDLDGEPIKTGSVDFFDEDNGIVHCSKSSPHNLQYSDYVSLSNMENSEFSIKIIDSVSFSLKDFNKEEHKIDESIKNIIFTQVKQEKEFKFKSMTDSIENPEFVHTDMSNFDKPAILHNCFKKLQEAEEAGENTDNVEKQLYNMEQLDSYGKIKAKFYMSCNGNLCPLDAIIGGIAAQEVLKACSRKFTPIKQWLYYDVLELVNYENINHCKLDNRYIGQIELLGQTVQDKLKDQTWFVVGSGAIGCELLKNFAMIGLGKVYLTDMDTIERSNLNRQFLFRNKDIGKMKSEAAASAIKEMNPDMKVISHQNKVGPDTEDIYNNVFYEEIDGIANALDNVQARLYMDEQCINYKKPLIDSGTLGTKGNVQVVLPNLTESYGSTRDPPEHGIPVCTLKNFPSKIDHTIQWARDKFEGLFNQSPMYLNKHLSDKNYLVNLSYDSPNEARVVINDITNVLNNLPKTYDDCIRLARNNFQDNYHNQISQLLHNFPPDHKTNEGGDFWSGSKRCPKPLIFNIDDDVHMSYIVSSANLFAKIFNINISEETEITEVICNMDIPKFVPKSGIKISTNDEELKKQQEEEGCEIDDLDMLIEGLVNLTMDKVNLQVNPEEFEKDDDGNYHMDFITSCSNLRAMNYGIEPCDKLKTKLIAGKIIPAIATTTAIVAGLATIELLKIVKGCDKLENYRDTFLNLGLSFFAYSEPKEAPKNKYLDKTFTLWDSFEVKGNNMTLKKFLDYFKMNHGLVVNMLTYGQRMLYSDFMMPRKKKKRMDKLIIDLVKEVGKCELDENCKTVPLGITCSDINDTNEYVEDLEVPPVKFYLNSYKTQMIMSKI